MLTRTLDPEQRHGARFLAARRVAMLADAPGVGKTAQIVRACDYVRARRIIGITTNRTLALNTAREFRKWGFSGWPSKILNSGKDTLPDSGLVITTYALARNPRIRRLLRDWRADVLFCDEAHRLKEDASQQTVAILSSRGNDGGAGIAHGARHTWLATGTPVPNHAGELFVFARVAGLFQGNFAAWVSRFCVEAQGDSGPKIVGSKNFDELRALLAPVYLRREQRAIAKPRLSEMLVEGKHDPYADLPAADRGRILQAIELGDYSFADTPAMATVRRLVGLAKVPGVVEIAAGELDGGQDKLLIFCQHTDVIRAITERLAPYGALLFDGKISQRERERVLQRFVNDPAARVCVCQMQAAAEGIDDFKIANRVLLAEPAWTPKDNEQAIARAARRGQARDVHATFVFLAGSLDEAISTAIQRKTADILKIV